MPGIQPLTFRLQKTLLFDDVTWTFEKGLSVVYGLNRATAKTSSNGNGAGKSAVFSLLGETLYESPVIGDKRDAVKSGTRTLDLIMNDKPVQIIRDGNKLDIKINGKSKFRTKPKARKWLEKNFPINEEEYQSFVHIDARQGHPLVMGSSTTRKKFFNTFFGLDKMDVERRLFQAELSKLGKVRAAYDEVRSEYEHTKTRLEAYSGKDLKAKINAVKDKLVDLNAKNTKVQDIGQLLSFERSAAKQIEEFLALCPEADQDNFDELMKTARWNRKTNRADLEEAQEWEQHQRETRQYIKAFEALGNNAKAMITKLGRKGLIAKYGSSSADARELRADLKTYEAQIAACKKTLKEELPKRVDARWDKKEVRSQLDALEHQYEHARKFKKGQCETCGQDVEVKDPEVIKDKIRKAKRKLEIIAEAAEYDELVAERTKATKDLKTAEAYCEEHAPRLHKLQRYAEIVDEVRNLPDRPGAFKGKKLDAPILQRMLEEDNARIQLLEFIGPNLTTIREITQLTTKQRDAASIAPKLRVRINELQEQLGKLRVQAGLYKELKADAARLKERVDEMAEQLKDEEPLRLLVEGYSDKAMKKMAIKTIASRLMQEVNKYARIVFPEDFTFEFSWEKSDMSIIADRKHGKKRLISDVRKLSGAESKLFTLVLVMALMTFVPARKRCSVLILDEPAANFSLETLVAFKQLLPVLNKVFPSIVLITPRTDERYEGAKEFTILKEKTTRILKGHPSMYKGKK